MKRDDAPTERYNTKESEKVKIKGRWWREKESEIHIHTTGIVNQISQNQSYRETANIKNARLYSNQVMVGLKGSEFARIQGNTSGLVSWNVIKAGIDTLSSKIAKNKPKPMYLTDGANWQMQRKAKLKTTFMQSQFLAMGTGQADNRTLYGIGRQSFVDSCIFGLGVTKFFVDNGRIYAERVLPNEIVVDEVEGRYQCPRQMHQVKLMHKDTLCEMFPKHEAKIMAASSGLEGESETKSSADMLQVTESWHLPSGKNAKDGKHAICIENGTLFCEEWKKDYFPFLFQRWNPGILGFYGIGVAEELRGIQLDINKTLMRITQSQHLMAVPQAWLEIGSKTVTAKMNNQVGALRYYQGRPPTFLVPPAMSAEVYQHLENQYRKAFEIIGVSQLSAQGKKPAGLDSGKALREFQDIESERFALAQLRYEDWYMDAAELISDMLRDLKEQGEDVEVKCQDGNGLKILKWSDVDVPDNLCLARPFPTNFLSSTPAGKLQDVQELMQAGIFDRDEGLELLDYPDVNAAKSEKLAPRECNRLVIESALYDGKYIQPEPFMALDKLLPMTQLYYLRAKAQGAPEDRLELLRRLMDDVDAILNPEVPEPEVPPVDPAMAGMDPAMAGMDPAAAGMDPAMMQQAALAQAEQLPTSDLLPMG